MNSSLKTPSKPVTVLSRLHSYGQESPHRPAYVECDDDGNWVSTSWYEFDAQVCLLGRALMALGVAPGGTVGILGTNRPEWTVCCLGSMAIAAVPVGIYQTCAAEQVAYILAHAESRVVVVENHHQWEKVEQVLHRLPALEHVVLMDGGEDDPHPKLITWPALLARGRTVREEARQAREASITPGQLATLIYTSGTTGSPKAVMLSHANIVQTGGIGARLHRLRESDSTLSYLPLAHIAEQMISIHISVFAGYQVFYVPSPERLADSLQQVQPTIFFGVPRVWERIHGAVTDKLAATGSLRRGLLAWALRVGRKVTERHCRGAKVSGPLALERNLAERLVLQKVRQRLGFSRARIAISGAAPIRRDVLDFFAGLGVCIYEVYGLSESCGPATWNSAGRTRLGSVGPALPEVDVKIAEDGEILVCGPNVFQGYFKDAQATEETLRDGWLHTGDVGRFDAEGFLSITGRKKEILITSGGKNIAPAGIEAALKGLDLVAEAVVLGDGRRYVTALLSLEEAAAAALLVGNDGENAQSEPEVKNEEHTHPRIIAAVQNGVERVNRQLARVETVRQFRILPRDLSLEKGELTPTLKVKRRVVEEHFADLIEEMYTS